MYAEHLAIVRYLSTNRLPIRAIRRVLGCRNPTFSLPLGSGHGAGAHATLESTLYPSSVESKEDGGKQKLIQGPSDKMSPLLHKAIDILTNGSQYTGTRLCNTIFTCGAADRSISRQLSSSVILL